MRWSSNYHQACRIQDKILLKIGVPLQNKKSPPVDPKASEDLTPKDLAALAAAWNTLEDRKRILRMKPLPKAVEVKVAEKKVSKATFTE